MDCLNVAERREVLTLLLASASIDDAEIDALLGAFPDLVGRLSPSRAFEYLRRLVGDKDFDRLDRAVERGLLQSGDAERLLEREFRAPRASVVRWFLLTFAFDRAATEKLMREPLNLTSPRSLEIVSLLARSLPMSREEHTKLLLETARLAKAEFTVLRRLIAVGVIRKGDLGQSPLLRALATSDHLFGVMQEGRGARFNSPRNNEDQLRSVAWFVHNFEQKYGDACPVITAILPDFRDCGTLRVLARAYEQLSPKRATPQ
jgi:hypothetical protein